jgi:hypothetical protein
MLAHLSFLQVFFSNQFTEYIDIKDLSVYRRICKKSRDMKIYLSVAPSMFTRLQLKHVVPNNTESYTIKNTHIKIKYNNVNRYFELFNSINIHHDIRLDIDSQYDKDIDDYQKQKLIDFKKTHYMCLKFDVNTLDTYFEYVLCFQSQREVFTVVNNIIHNITRSTFITNNELHVVLEYVVDRFYSGYLFCKRIYHKL